MISTDFLIKTFFLAMKGIPVTLKLTFVTLIVSSFLGFFVALAKINGRKVSAGIFSVYVSLVRSTPVVLQILFLYSLLPSLLNYVINVKLNLNWNIFGINPIFYAYIIFTLNTTAILSEVFRSAILTVNKGQMEAALTSGLTKTQAYVRIIIPQAFRVALPNIANTTIGLMKSTSLAFMMTVKDITAIAKTEAAFGYNYIEAYLDIAVIYILLCTVLQIAFRLFEKNYEKKWVVK